MLRRSRLIESCFDSIVIEARTFDGFESRRRNRSTRVWSCGQWLVYCTFLWRMAHAIRVAVGTLVRLSWQHLLMDEIWVYIYKCFFEVMSFAWCFSLETKKLKKGFLKLFLLWSLSLTRSQSYSNSNITHLNYPWYLFHSNDNL